jgi:cytoskeletal protein CcmA (bactofilin family)
MNSTAEIGPSIQIKGKVTAEEPLTIAGQVVGTVEVVGHPLTVTEAARVTADIIAHTILIDGFVSGSLCADARIVVRASATVEGELSAPAVSVADGASLRGRVQTAERRGSALPLAS